MLPHDQAQRDRFVQETDHNFSVMASAGGGKTRAISDRIVALARRPDAFEVLGALKVVTFTQKSAQELRDRARLGVIASKPSPRVLAAFNRSFFGTLHSFAVTVLKSHGHYIGVPSAFEVIEDDDSVWREFLSEHDGVPTGMDVASFNLLNRVHPYADLLPLVRSYSFAREEPVSCGEFPTLNFDAVFSFPYPTRKDTTANIKMSQEEFRAWLDSIKSGSTEYNPVPYPEKGGKDYLAASACAVAPLQVWIGRAVAETVHRLAASYRAFRVRTGRLTFNDQVALAADLLKHPAAARDLRAQGFRIILDEAQDTDIHQFTLLTEIARPASAGAGLFVTTLTDGPRPGHFCMVGDKQQAIYGARADVANYLNLHRALCESGNADSIEFAVTFRCDEAIVDFANASFPTILSGTGRQVAYVPLIARPGASRGQVLRLPISVPVDDCSANQKALHAARELGAWLKSTGHAALGASGWEQVALLCPRKDWFFPLRQGLAESGLPVTFQSTREVYGDSPAWAWFAGLAVTWAEPNNYAEIFGVLREVFGLSDHDIAVFANGDPSRLATVPSNPAIRDNSPVAETLSLLVEAGGYFEQHPIREAFGLACDKINLAGRLASLPIEQYPATQSEFSALLMRASDAEARGETLAGFAREIRVMLEKAIDTCEVATGSLPVITNLKSKGLQWDCVILPFFGREITYRNEPYPRFLPESCPVPLAFSRDDIPSEWSAHAAQNLQHEAERLLYVSLTRPKHTLVLVDDCSLWSGTTVPADRSFAATLRVNEENSGQWRDLQSTASGFAEISARAAQIEWPDVSLESVGSPAEASQEFPRRFLPHTLANNHSLVRKIEDPEQQSTVSPDTLVPDLKDSLAVKYGLWWHELMQRINWSAGITGWITAYTIAIEQCPERRRGEKEWALFLGSDAAKILSRPGVRVLAEVPFMAPISDGNSLDGVIDIVVDDPEDGWAVFDWKTNRGASVESLVERYRPQVTPYRDSISALTQSTARGFIYATSTGDLAAV